MWWRRIVWKTFIGGKLGGPVMIGMVMAVGARKGCD